MIIHTFTAALFSHISFAVLFESTQTLLFGSLQRLATDVRITHTVLLRQIMQHKYNQPLPMSKN